MNYLFTTSVDRSFMTSLEIIREVMNVPMEAIHAIARMNGISTADDHEQNISESALQPFIEAFERKTRNYFVSSMRNRAQLTLQELQTFTEFCKTFKKGNVSLGNVSNWNHIGKTKLREYFVERIKEKTPSTLIHHAELDLFSGCGGTEVIIKMILSELRMESPYPRSSCRIESLGYRWGLYDFEYGRYEYHRLPSKELLAQITSTRYYMARIETEVCYGKDVPDIIRRIVLSARYYVYVDDDEDHICDTVSVTGRHGHIINSTLKMVA